MIADVITRLQQQVAALKLVEGALSYSAVQVMPPIDQMPAAYVVELSESFLAASGMSGAKAQQGAISIAVILWLGVMSPDTKDAVAALEELRTAVKAALFGWSPPDSDGSQFAHAGGRLLLAEGNTVIWQQTFSLVIEERQS